MPKRSSKPDANEIAFRVVQESTAEHREPGPDQETEHQPDPTVTPAVRPKAVAKNRAAVALGRMGGKKGGKARAAKLSKEQRVEIAKTAAAARWKNKATGKEP